jgi:hypothetical protein
VTGADAHLGGQTGVRRRVVKPLQDTALDLPALDRRLNDHLGVVFPGGLDRGLQLRLGIDTGDAHAGTGPRRLDEHRPAELFDLVHDPLALPPPAAVADHDVRPDRESGALPDGLHEALVHAGGAGEDPRAHVADPGELEQALDRAVLAVRAVQQRQHHVDVAERPGHLAGLHDDEIASRAERKDEGQAVAAHLGQVTPLDREPLAGDQDPPAVTGDAHRDDLVAILVDRRHDTARGEAGDRMLRAAAAENDGDTDLAHASTSSRLRQDTRASTIHGISPGRRHRKSCPITR